MIRFGQPTGEYIKRLEVMGELNSGNEMSLKANHTELLARGTQEYILNMRDEIISNRTVDYTVPESWDLVWSFKQGPIMSPNNITDADCFMWFKPEQFVVDSANANKYIGWDDASTLGKDSSSYAKWQLDQSTASQRPNKAAKGLSSYEPMQFVSISETNVNTSNSATSTFDIPDTQDFLLAFVLVTPPDPGTTARILQLGGNITNGNLKVDLLTAGSNTKIRMTTRSGGSNTLITTANGAVTHSASHIILVGDIGNAARIRVNGTDFITSGTRQSIDPGAEDLIVGAGQNGTNIISESAVSLYEIAGIKDTGSDFTTAQAEQLEGYLAHKYGITESLPVDHAYKVNPPRTSVVKD